MIQDQIDKIQATLENSPGIPEQTRADLLKYLASLQSEIADKTTEPDAFDGLKKSVEGLESSHPEMVGMVNRLATTLSNMGI